MFKKYEINSMLDTTRSIALLNSNRQGYPMKWKPKKPA
jgi:hypothetical protein